MKASLDRVPAFSTRCKQVFVFSVCACLDEEATIFDASRNLSADPETCDRHEGLACGLCFPW